MRMALLPLGTRRRSPLPLYIAIAATFILVLNFFWTPWRSDGIATWRPSASNPSTPSEGASTLRPDGYLDTSRVRVLPEAADMPPFEPYGPGTYHDHRNNKFYLGGLSGLTSKDTRAVVYDPYPLYNTAAWRGQWKGDFQSCEGPRGADLDRSSPDDMTTVYRGNQEGFPFPAFGSYEAVGLDGNVCMDRCSRYAIYGHDEQSYEAGCRRPPEVRWNDVHWGGLQARCLERNANRFRPTEIYRPSSLAKTSVLPPRADALPSSGAGSQFRSRTALIIRTWSTMEWTDNHKQYVRSLIMELSLHSGGEYELFLLVDVKDPIFRFNEESEIRRIKETHIPPEFHDITVLFNTEMLEAWYPKIEEHRAVYQHLQPIQVFAQLHPQFDYYWQLEMDSRHTGHSYHFMERAVEFAKAQPRKYLWERNSYFYTPGFHGDWPKFKDMVDRSMVGREDKSIWGPVAAEGFEHPIGPVPPVTGPSGDNYRWGVGEEADLITFLPIFDARETNWSYPNLVYAMNLDVPRRASVITMWRMSAQLLDAIHKEQQKSGRGVVSEMTGPTWAMLHGLKAVHVPHPLYLDGQWTSHELASIMNPGEPEKVNGGRNSIWNFNHAFDHIMYRISYMFTTQTAEDLFRRWLGFPPDPNQYTDGSLHRDPQDRYWYDGGILDEKQYGRLCYPPMFLHTIKNTAAQKGKDMAVPV